MTMPIPTKQYVEAAGGHWFRSFPFPVPDELQPEYWSFKCKEPQLRHDHFVSKDLVIVYSLPTKGKWRRNESEPEKAVASEGYDSTVEKIA